MADVYVDGRVLDETRRTFDQCEQLLMTPCRRMRHVDHDVVGDPALARRVETFAREWSFGIEALAEYAHAAGGALTKIAEQFEQADRALAQALDEARAQGPRP